MEAFAIRAGENYEVGPEENVGQSIFQQYERVIVESLITAFGLDFIITDRHGGDVDTINNVRKMDKGSKDYDPQMTYKNKKNEAAYLANGEYDKRTQRAYHSSDGYISANRDAANKKDNGTLIDSYTGKKIPRNAEIDLDHVIPTYKIHSDRGRILAGLDGIDLANSPENLKPTDRSLNRSMQDKDSQSYSNYLNKKEAERTKTLAQLKNKASLDDKERKLLHKLEEQESVDISKIERAEKIAKKSYEAKINRAYYASPQFRNDVAKAAGTVGAQMGLRQALGFVFCEVWFSVKDEFEKVRDDAGFDLGEFMTKIADGVKRGVESAKNKYRELLAKFSQGAVAGILSSVTTTICNIFFTTAKNVVRILRHTWASIVEAAKVLFINPDNYELGDRMRAVVKILATGASVVVGVLVSEAMENTPIGKIPVVGEIVQTFCGTLVTGIMSCSLLYFLDRSAIVNKLVASLNNMHTMSTEVAYFRDQAEYFEEYAAKLMDMDIESFRKETEMYNNLIISIDGAESESEINSIFKAAIKLLGGQLPWDESMSFDDFMSDKSQHLEFK